MTIILIFTNLIPYLPHSNNVEVIFNIPLNSYDYDHVTFSAEFGRGRVTVLGSTFNGWYEDEAMMLANAVEYTSGAGGFGIDPVSGILPGSESAGINLMYSTYDMVGEYTGSLVLLTDTDTELNIPVSINVIGAPNIMVNMDVLDFGEVIVGDTVSAGFMVTNNGTGNLRDYLCCCK